MIKNVTVRKYLNYGLWLVASCEACSILVASMQSPMFASTLDQGLSIKCRYIIFLLQIFVNSELLVNCTVNLFILLQH